MITSTVKKVSVSNQKIVTALESTQAIDPEELAVTRFREAYRQIRESEPHGGELRIDLTLDLTKEDK